MEATQGKWRCSRLTEGLLASPCRVILVGASGCLVARRGLPTDQAWVWFLKCTEDHDGHHGTGARGRSTVRTSRFQLHRRPFVAEDLISTNTVKRHLHQWGLEAKEPQRLVSMSNIRVLGLPVTQDLH